MGRVSAFAATILFLLLVVDPAVGSETSCLSAVFTFGDWLVDAGRSVDDKQSPENCLSGSAGRVFVDYIAEFGELNSIPYFLHSSSDFSSGANFASRGAGVLPETHRGLTIDLQTQIKEFEKVNSIIVKEHGKAKASEIISNAVYFISAGTNDYIAYFNDPKIHLQYVVEDFQGMVIGNLSKAIQDLHTKGARKFCLVNLGPLGCMPFFRAINQENGGGGCVEEICKLAEEHNKAASGIVTVLKYLFEGLKFVNFNFYDWLNERSHSPSKYGFRDGESVCCHHIVEEDSKVCENSEEHFWWDSFRVSEAIHKQMATELWTSSLSQSSGSSSLKELLLSCNPTTTNTKSTTTKATTSKATTIGDTISKREELMG